MKLSPWPLVCAIAVLVAAGCDSPETVEESSQTSDSSDSDSTSDGTPSDDTTDTTSTIEWLTPPDGCAAPSPLPDDPLTLTSNSSGGQRHLINMAVDVETGRVYGVGTPGLEVFTLGNPPTSMGSARGKLEHVTIISETVVAATSRGRTSRQSGTIRGQGLYLFDVSAPSNPSQLSYVDIEGASGIAYQGGYLYLLSHDGRLRTFDISNTSSPSLLNEVSGLANPWEMTVAGDYAYVADNTLGIVVVDLSQPEQPLIGATISARGGVQDIVHADNHIYAAIGSKGVEIFSVADPEHPASLGAIKLGGPVISVSVANERLWATNQESVLVADISDPANPIQLAVEDTPSWAMHVKAIGDTAYVADWRTLSTYDYDAGKRAPDADPSQSEVYFVEGTQAQVFTLTNRGGADLQISGMQVPDERFAVLVDELTIAPGDSATIRLEFAADGESINTQLCIATNDPDEAVQHVTIASTSAGSSVLIGQPAPNFNLPDLNGNYYELARQLGSPVILSYFATW